ncbi:hypothetical protein Tco_0255411 [Tanacetum coccineum]
MGGIFSLEARDMDTKLLSAPESNNTLARYYFQWLALCLYSSWLDGPPCCKYYTGQCKGGSISPEGFLSSVLLWLVIIIAVVGVVVTVIVFIIVAVVVVAVERSSVVKLFQMVKFVFHLLDLSSGMILLYQNLLEFNLGASLSLVFLLVLSAFAIVVNAWHPRCEKYYQQRVSYAA